MCRHTKRYQDIEELLNAEIDVYTTVNVQHIESLNDTVASITGIMVHERIPDSVLTTQVRLSLWILSRRNRLNGYKRAKFITRLRLSVQQRISLPLKI